MIAVDTSALMAIILNEPQASRCIAVLEAEQDVLISTGTAAEAMIVATTRNVGAEMESLISQLGFEIVPLTGSAAMRIAQIYAKWGKGMNPASLNFGDCFAYDVAKQNDCSLLYVGEDFSRTDLKGGDLGSKGGVGMQIKLSSVTQSDFLTFLKHYEQMKLRSKARHLEPVPEFGYAFVYIDRDGADLMFKGALIGKVRWHNDDVIFDPPVSNINGPLLSDEVFDSWVSRAEYRRTIGG